MTIDPDYKRDLSSLRTILPATTSAWVRLLVRYEVHDETDPKVVVERCWHDDIYPVLGYAVSVPGTKWGEVLGAYLLDFPVIGPSWVIPLGGINCVVEFSTGKKPGRGEPMLGFTEGFAYDSGQIILDDLCNFNFISFTPHNP